MVHPMNIFKIHSCQNRCFRLELFQQIMCRWGGRPLCDINCVSSCSECLVQKLQHLSVGTAVSGIHRVGLPVQERTYSVRLGGRHVSRNRRPTRDIHAKMNLAWSTPGALYLHICSSSEPPVAPLSADVSGGSPGSDLVAGRPRMTSEPLCCKRLGRGTICVAFMLVVGHGTATTPRRRFESEPRFRPRGPEAADDQRATPL